PDPQPVSTGDRAAGEPASAPPARMTAAGTRPALQAVPALQPTEIREAPHPAPVPPSVVVKTLEDIVALADQHRDIAIKVQIRNCLRLVRMEPGRLEVALTEDAPKTLLGDLSSKLENWTGERWMLTLSRETGRQTLAEAEAAKREALVSDARQDPDIAAILKRFPGARITDVRIGGIEPDTPTAAESEEGDILPVDVGDTE
ncbi:MAG TPA: DNA polymerase III subunit gamma/tau, partial [Pararhizobium sp.]|nr:DNA polymerase III subunit gamma/tau [Pararhizobium sp.]